MPTVIFSVDLTTLSHQKIYKKLWSTLPYVTGMHCNILVPFQLGSLLKLHSFSFINSKQIGHGFGLVLFYMFGFYLEFGKVVCLLSLSSMWTQCNTSLLYLRIFVLLRRH